MRGVPDASVLVKLATAEADSPLAEPLLHIGRTAPDLLFADMANILWKKQVRGELTAVLGQEALSVLAELDLNVVPSRTLMADDDDRASRIRHVLCRLSDPAGDTVHHR